MTKNLAVHESSYCPSRRLVRRSDMSDVGGEAEVVVARSK